MSKNYCYPRLLCLLAGILPASAQFIQPVPESTIPITSGRVHLPESYDTFYLDDRALEAALAGLLPGETRSLILPLPEGERRFVVSLRPLMEPELARRYPDLYSFSGHAREDARMRVCGDLNPDGLHIMVRAPGGTYFIDPYQPGDRQHLIAYAAVDLAPRQTFNCRVVDPLAGEIRNETTNFVPYGAELLTYRFALAATAEYTQFHGGTVKSGLAATVVTLNRVNLILETELAIRLILVASNDALIYTDAGSDPYDNSDINLMSIQNQSNIDNVIGPGNYDLGHVLGTTGGGTALLEGVCQPGLKARAATGQAVPQGDPFDVDYVAHEVGHQLGAFHVFNGTSGDCSGQRQASHAYEPGSGSSIMGYAGLCDAEDLQDHSDDYFHVGSLMTIAAYTRAGLGNGCAAISATGNTPPVVSAGADFTIPRGTPFMLSGNAHDGEGDPLLYSWEQFDLGAAAPPNTDNGDRPIMRGYAPVSVPFRRLPNLAAILGLADSPFESLPQTTRLMSFRLTVRDSAGGAGSDEMDVAVRSEAGPFTVDPSAAWTGGEAAFVTWQVASTDLAPIDCGEVEIRFSEDGGFSYQVLADAVPNSGSRLVEVPNLDTNMARLLVACEGNIFFAVSAEDFTVSAVPTICTTLFGNWQRVVAGSDYQDVNGNGFVDVADFVFCGVAP